MSDALDEILFAFRNKEFGAYELRKKYSSRLFFAFYTSTFFFLLLIFIPYFLSKNSPPTHEIDENILEKIDEFTLLPPQKQFELPAPIIPESKPLEKEIPVVSPEIIPEKEPEKPKEDSKIISNTDSSKGEETTQETVVQKDTTQVAEILEDRRSSPFGGLAEFIAYLQKNVVYPPKALEQKVEGTVYVKFTVGLDGTIENAEVSKGFGYGCEEAAVKVVMGAPKWIPAVEKGKIVKQIMIVPVKFRLTNP